MNINLRIADYGIKLVEAQGYPRISWPLHPFDAFLDSSDRRPELELAVTVVEMLPTLQHGPLRFDACHGLWQLYEAETGWLLDALDTETHQPWSRALIAEDCSRAEVWTRLEQARLARGWVPMKIINPIAEVCLLTLLAREGGILLHSAGVLSPTGNHIFAGASGTGKSTLSGFFAATGATILSDERMIICRNGNDFVMHGTPWVGSGAYAENESGMLTGLWCIEHAPSHSIESLSPTAVLSFLLRQCFLPHWDRAAMEATLAFLDDLIHCVPCRRLAFAKQPDIVDYVKDRFAGTALVSS